MYGGLVIDRRKRVKKAPVLVMPGCKGGCQCQCKCICVGCYGGIKPSTKEKNVK